MLSINARKRSAALLAPVACLLAALLLASGCGGDESGPAQPDGIVLSLGSRSAQVTRQVSVSASHTFPRRDTPACDWYVNDTLGGSGLVGTISQDNPATFTAPHDVPAGGRVIITAVSREDPSHSDSDTLSVMFTIRYVDGAGGSDASGGGRWTEPLRTLSFALGEVASGDTVVALAGTYDQAHGEDGSFFIPAGATLRGENRASCLLSGSGSEYRVVELGDDATLACFTIENAGSDQIAVLSTGGGSMRDVAIEEPFDFTAIRADGSGSGDNDVVIEGCSLVNSMAPLTGRGIEAYYGSHCVIRDCEISGWQTGVYANRDSDPLIEGSSVTGNVFGIISAGGGGLLTQPDLGGGARDSAGGNSIRDNTLLGVSNQTSATIWALSNNWTHDPPTEGPPYPADIQNTSGGTVVWSRQP